MRTILVSLCCAACLLIGATASAQTPVPSPTPAATKLAWDHDGLSTDGYKLKIDGEAAAIVTPTCAVVASVRTCEIAFPALTPGNHALVIIAFNAAGETASAPFPVTVFVAPAVPVNLRIKG